MKKIYNKRKSILIVGGGLLQSYAILIAKQKGLKVFLTDGSNNCYCKKLADKFFCIDTKNFIETAKLALKLKKFHNLAAVYTQGTDVSYTVAYVAEKCKLKGIKSEIAYHIDNKTLMRKKLKNTKLDTVNFFIVKKFRDLNNADKKINYPMYVKPADNCASRGITKVKNYKDLKTAYFNALKNSIDNTDVLIEEAIVGKEYSIDTIVYENKIINCGISDRIFTKNNRYAIQIGSTTPSILSEKIQLKMINLMQDAANIFKVNNVAFKGDLIVDKKDNVKIIELTTRTSGGFDSQVRKPASFGINIINATIDLALNNMFNIQDVVPKWIKWSRTISIIPPKGKVAKIIGINWLKKQKYIVDIKILVKKGTMIEKLYDSGSRCNFITFIASDLLELNKRENNIRNNFNIIVK